MESQEERLAWVEALAAAIAAAGRLLHDSPQLLAKVPHPACAPPGRRWCRPWRHYRCTEVVHRNVAGKRHAVRDAATVGKLILHTLLWFAAEQPNPRCEFIAYWRLRMACAVALRRRHLHPRDCSRRCPTARRKRRW